MNSEPEWPTRIFTNFYKSKLRERDRRIWRQKNGENFEQYLPGDEPIKSWASWRGNRDFTLERLISDSRWCRHISPVRCVAIRPLLQTKRNGGQVPGQKQAGFGWRYV